MIMLARIPTYGFKIAGWGSVYLFASGELSDFASKILGEKPEREEEIDGVMHDVYPLGSEIDAVGKMLLLTAYLDQAGGVQIK